MPTTVPPFPTIRAPLASASSHIARSFCGFPGSGSGVAATPSSHGIPRFSPSAAAASAATNGSATRLCT